MDKKTIIQQYNELKEKYKVEHLLNQNKEVIFVLESPHIDELLNKAPVSGLSGKTMSKVIFGDNEKTPIGIITKNNPTSKIGIMNVCSIPMQRIAYTNEDVINMYGSFDLNKYNSFFDILEKLRTGTKSSYKDNSKNMMQEIILSDFKNELNKLKNRELIFIPCGKTAEVFFEIANVKSDKWKVLVGTPHPSFGNWLRVKYKSKIEEVKQLIK